MHCIDLQHELYSCSQCDDFFVETVMCLLAQLSSVCL